MSATEPQISVILPAFNETAIIAQVVQSIQAVLQVHGQPFEILVIDDGSDDDTARQAESAGARVLRHPYNIGNGAAIKTGIRNARANDADAILLLSYAGTLAGCEAVFAPEHDYLIQLDEGEPAAGACPFVSFPVLDLGPGIR